MDWLIRNLSFLAFLLVVAVLALGGLTAWPMLRLVPMLLQAPTEQVVMGAIASLLIVGLWLLAMFVGYGLLVRFLGLCDDIAAIRRAQTGTWASLD
jgi:hypothetical protein